MPEKVMKPKMATLLGDIFKRIIFLYEKKPLFSGNGLTPNRRKAIIWTNVGLVNVAYVRHSAPTS